MRLTTRTDLALRTLMFCAVNPDRFVRKAEVAARCNASQNHLAQVINLLAQRGYLETRRGRSGGLSLGHPAADISVGAVLRSFESCLPLAECFDLGANTCPLASACRLKTLLGNAIEDFYAGLDKVSLADLVTRNTGLATLLETA